MAIRKKAPLGKVLSYKFDNFMSGGPKAIFLALTIVFVFALVITGGLRFIVDVSLNTPIEESLKNLWINFLQITDAGAIAENTESPIIMKTIGIITMFLGLIFFSAVVAFITTQLDAKLSDLKKGRSEVIEEGHVLILGWGEVVIEIIRELILANESEKRASVVILSENEKEEMDDYLAERIPNRKTTKIITRNGKPSSLDSLRKVGVANSKSVIILPSCTESASEDEKTVSDAKVLKTILAVVAAIGQNEESPEIIAEIFDETKRDVMISLNPDKIKMVRTGDIIAKIIVQTSRTSGLAFVYGNLIGFDGSEMYFYKGNWNQMAFGKLKYHFVDGVPIGLKNKEGQIMLNPPADYSMREGDEIVIIAEDDSSIQLSPRRLFIPKDYPISEAKRSNSIEKEMVIGWNAKARIIIEEYAEYILAGSVITVVVSEDNLDAVDTISELKKSLSKISINLLHIDPLNLDDLRTANLESYDNVILLNEMEEDSEKIDATTITKLLLIKSLFAESEKASGKKIATQLISEVMNSDNLELISKTGVNDSIISFQMVSKIMAQIAENPSLLEVYEDLFSEEGSEIYLKPIELYYQNLPDQLKITDMMHSAEKRGEIFIGYRYKDLENSIDDNFGVFINIPKDTLVKPKSGDMFIVLSENDL